MALIIWFIAFISLFALSVFFHELGHFVFSKMAGIKVYEFSIGLPFIPRIATVFKYKETEFTLKLIPIGGFISYTPTNTKERASVYEFLKYPGWRRLVATLGGPLFNFLFAFIVGTIVMLNGISAPSLKVQDVVPNSAAYHSGFKPGDVIVAVNGEAIEDWEKLKDAIVKNSQQPVKLTYKRQGNILESEIIPAFNEKREEMQIGIVPVYVHKKYSLMQSFQKSYNFMGKIFSGFVSLAKKIIRKRGSAKDFSGPVGIGNATQKAINKGNNTYWLLLAFFSVNLGILNLLPLPSLDGGQIIAYSIEAITGKTFDLKVHQIFGMIGMLIIILIFILVTYSDVIIYWFGK